MIIWFTVWMGVYLGVRDMITSYGCSDGPLTFVHRYECTDCGHTYKVEHDDAALYVDHCPQCGASTNDPHEICGIDDV